MTKIKGKTYKEYMVGKSDKELYTEWLQLEDMISNTGCFGCRDLTMQDRIGAELGRRGYEINEFGKFVAIDL